MKEKLNIVGYLNIIGVLALIYVVFLQKPTIKTEIELIKGETITTVINEKKFDSLKYFYEAKLSKMKLNQFYASNNIPDTLKLYDTLYNQDISIYSAKFNIGDSVLGTSGIVKFGLEPKVFAFDSLEYRYPEILKERVDTLKTTETIDKPIYKNEWFYTTVALSVALLTLLAGG